MRIAMVTDSFYPTRDGVVTSLCITKKGLEDRGHEVFIVAPDPGKEHRMEGIHYFPAVSFKGYEGYFLPILPSNKLEILREIDPDVIHIHGVAVMALKALIAARALGKPTVLTFHTSVGDTMQYYSPIKMPKEMSDRLVWTYLRNLLKRPFAIIAPTEPVSEELEMMGVHAKEIAVIPTGVDTVRFRPENDGRAVRERYALDGKKVLIHVGRISFEKNLDTVVDAVGMIDDIVLMIVGKGPAEEQIKEQIRDKGMEDRVIFTGFVDDSELPNHYAAANAAVSASRFETQGLSILEAMASGLPVACVDERAFSSFMDDGNNGFIFKGGQEDCAEAISRALSSDEDVKMNARRTAERFSITSAAEELERLYERAALSKRKER